MFRRLKRSTYILKLACAFVAAGWISFFPVASFSAQSLQLDEEKIKAGLLYNFLKYTDWPGGRVPLGNANLVICLYGGDPYSGALSALEGKTVQQRRIELATIYTVKDLALCNAVVINSSAEAAVPEILRYTEQNGILNVSDIPGFTARGGMIEFGLAHDRIQVFYNAKSISAAKLAVSSRMLKLAQSAGGP